MKLKTAILVGIVAVASAIHGAAPPHNRDSATVPVVHSNNGVDSEAMRLEGEKRFRVNCGRCHAAPEKFPPRMMATIVRHMRVRATITDEDMHFILYYMTQ